MRWTCISKAWLARTKGLTPEYLAQARGFFERALALDPENVEALVGMANVDAAIGAIFMTDDRARALCGGRGSVDQGSFPGSAACLGPLRSGLVLIFTNRAAQGIAECERALALDRNLADAHALSVSPSLYIGRGAETEAHIHEALRLSPRDILPTGG